MMANDKCLQDQRILPAHYAVRLYYSGMLTIISVAVSISLELYVFTFIAVGVLLNSINYWRYPVRGWRRNLDMTWSCSGCLYQMYASFRVTDPTYFVGYWSVVVLAVASYRMARRCDRVHHNLDAASKWHVGLHVLGNVSNLILYYGLAIAGES